MTSIQDLLASPVSCPTCGCDVMPPTVCPGCGLGIPAGTDPDWARHTSTIVPDTFGDLVEADTEWRYQPVETESVRE